MAAASSHSAKIVSRNEGAVDMQPGGGPWYFGRSGDRKSVWVACSRSAVDGDGARQPYRFQDVDARTYSAQMTVELKATKDKCVP